MPDGRISYVNSNGVWIMNADGSGKRKIAHDEVSSTGYPGVADVAWSPDAPRVAFTTNTALWVMNPDGHVDPAQSCTAVPARPVDRSGHPTAGRSRGRRATATSRSS